MVENWRRQNWLHHCWWTHVYCELFTFLVLLKTEIERLTMVSLSFSPRYTKCDKLYPASDVNLIDRRLS